MRCLSAACASPDDDSLAREVEASCHAIAATEDEYVALLRRCAFELGSEGGVAKGTWLVRCTDEQARAGTTVGKKDRAEEERQRNFQDIVAAKISSLDDETFATIVKCAKCGSSDVVWDEKQTRSADEGATLFCSCKACGKRWILR